MQSLPNPLEPLCGERPSSAVHNRGPFLFYDAQKARSASKCAARGQFDAFFTFSQLPRSIESCELRTAVTLTLPQECFLIRRRPQRPPIGAQIKALFSLCV